jgi:hypothetical protein
VSESIDLGRAGASRSGPRVENWGRDEFQFLPIDTVLQKLKFIPTPFAVCSEFQQPGAQLVKLRGTIAIDAVVAGKAATAATGPEVVDIQQIVPFVQHDCVATPLRYGDRVGIDASHSPCADHRARSSQGHAHRHRSTRLLPGHPTRRRRRARRNRTVAPRQMWMPSQEFHRTSAACASTSERRTERAWRPRGRYVWEAYRQAMELAGQLQELELRCDALLS